MPTDVVAIPLPPIVDLKDEGDRRELEKCLEQWHSEFSDWVTAAEESVRLTEDDFAIRINAKG